MKSIRAVLPPLKQNTQSVISNTVLGFGFGTLDLGQTELGSGNYNVETRFDGTNWQFRILDSASNPVSIRLSDGSGYSTDWQNIPASTGNTISYDTGRGLTINFGADAALYSAATVGAGAALVKFP